MIDLNKSIYINCSVELNRPYYLLLTDVKGSTRLAGEVWGSLIERLKAEVGELTGRYKPALGLSLNYGDEVTGFFEKPADLYAIAIALGEAVYPETLIRFVAVKGMIGAASQNISEVGGPVFKKASVLMDRIKKERRYSRWSLGVSQVDRALDALSESAHFVRSNMTPYQREVYLLLKEGLNQSQIAERLGKQPQSVSDAVKRGGAERVIECEEAIQSVLKIL